MSFYPYKGLMNLAYLGKKFYINLSYFQSNCSKYIEPFWNILM